MQQHTDINRVIDTIYTLANNKIQTVPKNASVIRATSSEALHDLAIAQYERVAMIFPVEDVAHEVDQVGLVLYTSYGGMEMTKQLIFMPAEENGMVNFPLAGMDRRTNAQLANIVTEFICTGNMPPQ